MRTALRAALALAIAAGSAAPLRAQGAAPAALAITVVNRTAAAESARGAPRADSAVRADDVLHYRLVFTNVAGRPVRGVALRNPIPAGLRVAAGSVRASRADARPEFSADGGRTFAAQPTETVVVAGKQVRRPVPPERYTHVRWTVDGWVAPAATITAEYDARPAGATPAAAPAR